MALSALFGLGFAGNMTCLSPCVRDVVPASRFGGAMGAVMMVAWAGMAAGGYVGGVLFDLSLSYTLSFVVAGAAGAHEPRDSGGSSAFEGHRSPVGEPDGYVGGNSLVR